MGDTGAMLLGLLLAYAPISSLASLDQGQPHRLPARRRVNRFAEILPLLLPAAILLIPYADLLMAVVRRTRAGMSPFAPDRKHLHHRHAGHRPLAPDQRPDHVPVGGAVLRHRGLAVDRPRPRCSCWSSVTLVAVLALLFVSMPRLRPWARTTAAQPRHREGRRAAGRGIAHRGARPPARGARPPAPGRHARPGPAPACHVPRSRPPPHLSGPGRIPGLAARPALATGGAPPRSARYRTAGRRPRPGRPRRRSSPRRGRPHRRQASASGRGRRKPPAATSPGVARWAAGGPPRRGRPRRRPPGPVRAAQAVTAARPARSPPASRRVP